MTYQETLGKTRGTATEIVEVFEELLDRYGIYVPDEDRNGDENEACLYGCTYGNLVDEITSILAEYIDE